MINRSGLGLMLALAFSTAAPALAQDTPPAPAPAAEAPAAEAPAAEPAAPPQRQVYVRETVKDWQVRCVKIDGQTEPCQGYQLLKDTSGTPTAEVTIFRGAPGGRYAAGMSIICPLETLLPAGLSLQIDSSPAKRYPFVVCNRGGCVAQVGLSAEDLAALKRGNAATVSIVPFVAQDQKVDLKLSLSGFTGAFDQLPEQAGAAQGAVPAAPKQ